MSEEETYIVEKIIGKKLVNGKTLYNVKWEGYTETTWEPKENLSGCTDLLKAYEKSLQEKSKSPKQKERALQTRSSSAKTTKRGRKERGEDENEDSESMKKKKKANKNDKEGNKNAKLDKEIIKDDLSDTFFEDSDLNGEEYNYISIPESTKVFSLSKSSQKKNNINKDNSLEEILNHPLFPLESEKFNSKLISLIKNINIDQDNNLGSLDTNDLVFIHNQITALGIKVVAELVKRVPL